MFLKLKNRSALSCVVLMALFSLTWYSDLPRPVKAGSAFPMLPSVLGTWHGESNCVGNRPACKNEEVVYRFELVAGKSGVVTLLADKIIDGKREPMYKLEFQYDEAKGTLVCDFTRRQTHGLWEYKITGDKMEGTLVLLPDKTLGRQVKVNRVSEDQVPPAPDRKTYE